jgi:hypothetical protein
MIVFCGGGLCFIFFSLAHVIVFLLKYILWQFCLVLFVFKCHCFYLHMELLYVHAM